MPVIQVNMLAGRLSEAKQALMRRLTEATVETLGVDPSAVRVILHEVPPENWSVGGIPKTQPPAVPE